jgi:HlyD family secretion protein
VHRIALLSLVILLAVTLAGCAQPATAPASAGYTPPAQSSPQAQSTVIVRQGSLTETVEARGRVVSASEALLSFELEGVLTQVLVAPGDQVSEGEVLAEIESMDREGRTSDEQIADAQYGVTVAQLNLELARGELAIAQADAELCEQDVAQAETRLRQARYDYQLASYLEQPDKEPEEESDFTRSQRWALEYASLAYDRAVVTCTAREAAVSYQQLAVSLAEQSLVHAQELLARARRRAEQAQLRAPSSGIIISWEKRVGESVEPYDPIGAVADPDVLRLEAWVSEEDVTKVAPGQSVEVFLDLRPNETFAGQVVDVATESTVWQGKNVYVVDVEFTDAEDVPASIRTGADLVIETRRRIGVPLVPNSALFSEDDHYYVEVVRDGGRVKVEVQIGVSDGSHTEVLSGLVGGEEVVVP